MYIMKKTLLTLGDLQGYTEKQIKEHIITHYNASPTELKNVKILIAYESVGPYGCDSSSFFLIKIGRYYYENHASHCSCYGFEDQWKPEKTTMKYLQSDKFSFYVDNEEKLVKEHINGK